MNDENNNYENNEIIKCRITFRLTCCDVGPAGRDEGGIRVGMKLVRRVSVRETDGAGGHLEVGM